MDILKILDELTVEEKAALVSGTDFMYTNPVPRLNIPSIRMSDGPHGLRVQTEGGDNGIAGSDYATAFPTAATTACSWEPENTYIMGEAIGEESRYYGINIVLGPGANIKRNPTCGRNFEYFSEDPLLAGVMAAAEVKGIKSKDVGVAVKHFAMNNSENYRFMSDSVADERAAREIYLRVFERIVKDAHPDTMMCAYNQIGGEYCSENKWLLKDVLRDEWGFDGAVMTDWGAMRDRVNALKAGLDLEMPGDTAICRKRIIDGVASGELEMSVLDSAAINILRLVQKFANQPRSTDAQFDKHHILAAEIAADSAVLLKNDGVLPLDKSEKLLVVGDLFEKMRYQGAGSSMINPYKLTTPKVAFDESGIDYEFCRGYKESSYEPQNDLIAEAEKMLSGFDKVLVFAGLTDLYESEGGDRESMRLPENQNALIDALIKTGKKVIVVLFGGSPVELPYAKGAAAILNMFLPGQNGGTATRELLFGDKTPCGKLSETWAETYDDVPFGDEFSKNELEVYKESVYVGYRYYQTANKKVRYPFGFGLSYTTFDYSGLSVRDEGDAVTVSCTVKNTGERDGADIVQLYCATPKSDVFKPAKELRAFSKVRLKAGESAKVELKVAKDDLRYYNIKEKRWVLEGGAYDFQVCSDVQTVKLSQSVTIKGEVAECPYSKDVLNVYEGANLTSVTDEIFESMSGVKIPPLPPKKPITLESRFTNLQHTFMGRILFGAVLGVAKKQRKRALKMPEGVEKDNMLKGAYFLKRILESNSVRTMSMCAGKSMPYNIAQGFVYMANGRFIKGVKSMCSPIKAPKLPKETGDK